jgi:hypothetical protein
VIPPERLPLGHVVFHQVVEQDVVQSG